MDNRFFSPSAARPALWCAGFLLLAAVTGCDNRPMEPKTAGQQLDSAIDKTQAVAQKAATQTREVLQDVGQKLDAKAPEFKEQAREAGTRVQNSVDDMTVTAQVSAGLARDPDLSAIKIDVSTKAGAVVLHGPAPSEAAKERASTIARGVSGVVSVDNQLTVKAG